MLLVIHMDPVDTDDPLLEERRQAVLDILDQLDGRITLHDFRMSGGRWQIHLFFDIVVPYEMGDDQIGTVIHILQERIKAYDKRIECVITVDRSYTGEQ